MKKSLALPLLLIATVCFYNSSHLLAQDNPIEDKVDEYLNAYIQMNQFSGSVLIAKEGKVLLNKGYGYANHEFNIKNKPTTRFRIASLTKGFTALAIMQLREQDKLHLSDALSKFISDYPRGNEITIKHLLTNTSGIPNHTEFEDFAKERRVFHYTVSQTIETFKNKPLEFTPGDGFSYSNSNYILLGFIIEQVSGTGYAEYIEQNIFKLLNMEDSGFEEPQKVISNFAQGYLVRNNEVQRARFRDMSNAHASGALYSTIEDLYKWDRSLYTEELIGKKSLEAIFTPYKDNYAFGWGVVDVFNHRMIGHFGEIDGFTSNISRFPDEDVCIILLSNFQDIPFNRINRDLLALVFGEKYTVPEVVKTINLRPDILKAMVGDYELEPGFNFSILFSEGVLYCQPTGQTKLELIPISESEFLLKGVDAKISFEKNTNDEIEGLILHQGDKKFSALRTR